MQDTLVIVDSRTAKVLNEPMLNEGFMHVMFRLHVDLFTVFPGMLFLGFMGVLLVVAIISGVVYVSNLCGVWNLLRFV